MCTVTFLPVRGGYILTSSRDELISRKTLPPKSYDHLGQSIHYPKDEKGRGTWFAASDSGMIACLLNGAFKNHVKKDTYLKSRGQILLESFQFDRAASFHEDIDLEGVEPFTILFIKNLLQIDFHELRWDGKKKYFKKVNPSIPHIWSSITLYSHSTQKLRRSWFYQWIKKYGEYPDFNIFRFHTTRHSNNLENDILMSRSSGMQTISLSQFRLKNNKGSFTYLDLLANKVYIKSIHHEKHFV